MSGQIDAHHGRVIDYLLAENQSLHRQITSHGKRILLTDTERKSLAEKAVAMGKVMADFVTIAKPETVLKWHRKLVAMKFDSSKAKQHHGRRPVLPDVEAMILTLAKDNPSWGYDKIAGAIHNLGRELSDTTVANILRRHGISPLPERKKNTTWASFIRQHTDVLLATDFFTTEVWTEFGLTTFCILFFIHIKTRKIVIAGAIDHPTGLWVEQCARNITGWDSPFQNIRYIIRDRDAKYTKTFDNIFIGAGIEPVKLPPKSPNLNAFAERFVRSIKSECLDRLILFGEKSLKHVLTEYIKHFHSERNHQGIANVIPFPDARIGPTTGKVIKSERLGGLLNFYHRKAA